MITEFDTEIEKVKYYKDRIVNLLIEKGIYPQSGDIDKRLEAIDQSLAIFQYKDVRAKDTFNTEEFNSAFEKIYADLDILYRLVYKYCMIEYEKLKLYAETHLAELEETARNYKQKSKFETGSTSLGETLFFQTSGFEKDITNEITKIDLGEIKVIPGSRVACLIDAEDIDDSQVVFKVNGENCLPYTYNKDYIRIPGEQKKTVYDYEIEDDLKAESMRVMNINDFAPSTDNYYEIYAGKDAVIDTDRNGIPSVVKMSGTNTITTSSSKGKITFYIREGKYVKFDFSTMPAYKNFAGNFVENIKDGQLFEIEHNGLMGITIITDGKIYADKATGVINNYMLYYPDVIDTKDFRIIEYSNDESITVKASVSISGQDTEKGPAINMIALKQLPGDVI